MADEVSIEQLEADVERAREDPRTPGWVVLLLQAVLLLMRGMSTQLGQLLVQVTGLQAQLAEQQATNTKLRKQLYGKKSEKKPSRKSAPSNKPRKKAPRRLGPAALDKAVMPEEHERHTLPERNLVCPICGETTFVPLPTEDSVEYRYVPARLVRVHHHRDKSACAKGCTVQTAPGPDRVVEGGRFHASVYADIVTKRCLDAIPFHRQADALQRAGVPLSTSTICDLFHDAAKVLEPLNCALADEIRGSPLVHADETPQPVIDIGKTRRAYVWTFASKTLALFVHAHGRSGETPKKLLDKTVGTLVADAYSGYNAVTGPESRTRSGCLAHARRKFVDAESQAPRKVAWLVKRVAKIYQVESEARELGVAGTPRHLTMRQERSQPIMDEIRGWLAKQKKIARPKSAFGQAVSYMDNQWSKLVVFLGDANVPPDNNHAERLLRRIALGRKNSLFVADDDSGQRHAINMSLVASCRLNGIDPAAYLTDVLPKIAGTKVCQLPDLLPDRWQPPNT